MLILLDYFSVVIQSISLEASMRAKKIVFKQQRNQGRRFFLPVNCIRPSPNGLGLSSFKGCGSVVYDAILNVAVIVCGVLYFFLVLFCSAWCHL